MALEQGELTIVQTAKGARIDMGGGGSHSVSGPNAVKALMDAYGKRIGKVVDSSGNTTVINEYKENPKKEVDPSLLKDTGTVVRIKSGDAAGQYAIKYSDGTYNYCGTGQEGLQEASRRYSSAKLYNDFIQDGRTRADFDTEQQYKDFITVKNIRIGQGLYTKVGSLDGTVSLKAPNGATIGTGNAEEINKLYGSESNRLNLAMASAEKVQSISANEKRYIMESRGLDEQGFNNFIRDEMQKRQDVLNNIYNSWNTKATEQGISTEGTNWYKPILPDLTNFVPTITESDMPYNEWYKQNIGGSSSAAATSTGTGGGDTVGLTDQTITGEEGTTGTSTPTAVGNTNTDTTFTGGYYQPVLQTPTTSVTQVPGYQTVEGVYPTTGDTGTATSTVPSTTAGLSAVPQTITTYPNYTGTTMANLTSQSQQGFGGQRKYANTFGQEITVTVDAQGNPLTYVPPGYTPVQGAAKGGLMRMAEGGQTPDRMLEAKYRIATMNGYNGPKTNSALDAFANASPAITAKFRAIGVAVAKGGYIKGFAPGGDVGTATTSIEDFNAMQQGLITQTMQPIQSNVATIQPQEADFIAEGAGQAYYQAPMQEAGTVADVAQAGVPLVAPTSVMTPSTVTPGVQQVTEGLTAVQGDLGTQSQVDAAQAEGTSVSQLKAEQGTAIMMDNPVQREIQDGELISGVANAQKAAEFTEQIEAATAEPSQKATVQGQLEGLMQQFEGGNTPAWAAGSMRNAMATLSARGLGASSMAGQAVIQAAMEAALPIAQMDAQTQAQFESQNLSNRQQRAMLAAQQRAQFLGMEFDQAFQARVQNAARIGDIANMNFTAEQNIALENSRAANTMELNNLSNRQAMVMAEAAALSQLDMANLNNRQQAAVQNAQNFLQMDMANLSNAQQTAMFKAQQNIQALFTDQAAENAAAQFNASSENQANQFFANLSTQVGQFNAAQQNAMNQFNVNSVNAMRQFNSEIQQQRDLFNAQNGLVVAQANAQWRQNIATLNQAAQNESNMDFAKTINALTSTNLDQIWQRERDIMSFAFTAQQSALDRSLNLLLGDKKIAEVEKQLSEQKDAASTELAFRFLFGSDPAGLFGGIFNSKKG